MKAAIFACLLAIAAARPDSGYEAPGGRRDDSGEHIAIIRDDRHQDEYGNFDTNFETAHGIAISRSGSKLEHVENQPIGQQGTVQFTFPNGEEYALKFVADENGFQPESSWLPVAPAFPHPIPQFVLDQIEKAAREDAEEHRAAPSGGRTYQ